MMGDWAALLQGDAPKKNHDSKNVAFKNMNFWKSKVIVHNHKP